MSFWLTPTFHPNRPPCNGPTMIVIKSYGLCGQWYHCWDIIMTSCLHTYHPTCLGEHLKMNNRCKVYNQKLYLDLWSSWGFKDLDDDLTCMAQEMGLEEEHVRMLNELKETIRINVHDVFGLHLNCCFKHLHLCVYTHCHLICVLCK